MSRNRTTLIDQSCGFPGAPDVTHERKFAPVVGFIRAVRDALIDNASFQQPFLCLLDNLYNDPKASEKILQIHPARPMDDDILWFLLQRWLDVRLTSLSHDSTDYEWSYTYAGPSAAKDDRVHICVLLVRYWLRLAKSNKRPDFCIHSLRVMFLGVLIHELAHRIIVWWSASHCDTPQMSTIDTEAGEYVETCFFGGVLECWWSAGHVGSFKHLKDVGIETPAKHLVMIDEVVAQQILRFGQPQHWRLPLIDIPLLPSVPPLGPTLHHAKIAATNDLLPFRNTTLPVVTSRESLEEKGMKSQRKLRNDKNSPSLPLV